LPNGDIARHLDMREVADRYGINACRSRISAILKD
jgi:hypothetical protein